MSGGGQSLGGNENSEPLPAGWGRPSAPRVGRVGDWSGTNNPGRNSSSSSRGGFGSLSNLPTSGGARVPGGPQVGDDEDKEGENWFAGGERSGISVQNPNSASARPGGRLVRDILRQAAEGGMAPPPDARRAAGPFSGGGHILGSDEVESSYVPDPTPKDDEGDIVVRHLHLWRDGFSLEDGPLMRYDEPGNQELLRSIQQGTAPISFMDVTPGQRVNLNVATRLSEEYVPPKRGNFSGSGQRLGAPTPAITSGAAPLMPGSFPSGSSSAADSSASVERHGISTRFEVDQTQPTTSVQIRLADGTRMPCRMNLTHTVGDLRSFINASRPENMSRPYTIGTTFPNRTLEDDTQTIEGAGLANSVIVQRWV
ncbi:uncharacterized protein F5891DRAFT_1065655 [Suillus fuscotomentosus]|uniref:SEP-domain-containing protein n=1 Tax=Suillus fuscotomentosus TaxID=1912939 RepID=A0AAD4HEJ7_9AGAM|nr:uncharacterized protein F5891DRAFT_1065655 [Suillus fuscotomentosus]KAG1893622.1 hypothetical protein F5891DRAFT_1065655 [Suillus fuscotomentosus]